MLLIISEPNVNLDSFFNFFYFIDSRESRRERERQGEKHQCERERLAGCFLHMP